jgi:hypothetical protein
MTVTVEIIAEALRGTCRSLQSVLEDNDMDGADDDMNFCLALDSLVFCCEACEWWCEMSEMGEREDDRWICEECTREES